MFTVKEYTREEFDALRGAPQADVREGDRLFVLWEDAPKGVGILRLQRGKVLLAGVYGDLSPAYRDLMYRALLNVCRGFAPITVRVESDDPYFAPFGFTSADGGMEVRSDNIRFH